MSNKQTVMSEAEFILEAITIFRKLTAQQQLEAIKALEVMAQLSR